MRFIKILVAALSLLSFSIIHADDIPSNALDNPNVKLFIDEMVNQYHFDRANLNKLFTEVKYNQKSIDLMNKPYEAKPWYVYQTHFLTQKRVSEGVAFWKKYATQINAVSERTGIPPEVIVGIVGVETHYGALKGTFSAFDVLYTLSFYYPKRETFFRKELREYLLLCQEQKLDPLTVLGSYAGALGQPQFMPSSYRMYAVAFDGGKQANLFTNENDVISSVANYFARHGWQRNQPIASPAMVVGTRFEQLPLQDRNTKITIPTMNLAELQKYGVTVNDTLPATTKGTFMRFEKADGKEEYWVAYYNFYVLTRYNTSKLYAMAVYQLSQQVNTAYQKQAKV